MIGQKQIRELIYKLSLKLNKDFSNVENKRIAKEKLGIKQVDTYSNLPVSPSKNDIYLVLDASSHETNLEELEWALYWCKTDSPIEWIKIADHNSSNTDFGTW